MAQPCHLANAPIHEAVLDFVFSEPQIDKHGLEQLVDTFAKSGWKKGTIESATIEANLGHHDGAKSISHKSAIEGYALQADNRIIQVREDRVSVSHLKGYTNWEDLEKDAFTWVSKFVETSKPSGISRIGARFINRIALPAEPKFSRFAEYLTNPPRMPDGMEGPYITDFVRKQLIGGLENGCGGKLTVGTANPLPDETSKVLMIDVDVFNAKSRQVDFDFLHTELAVMRKLKNSMFFGSVTEKCLEPYR